MARPIEYIKQHYEFYNPEELIPSNDRVVYAITKEGYATFAIYFGKHKMESTYLHEFLFADDRWKNLCELKDGYGSSEGELDDPDSYWIKESWCSYNPLNDEENDNFVIEVEKWMECPK